MSALTLTSVTGIGGDKKLEEEKKKTEAERLKNGKIDQTRERDMLTLESRCLRVI